MNIIGAIVALIVIIPIALASLVALFSALMLLLPDPIEKARANLELYPWRSIFLGFLNFVAALVIIILLYTLGTNFFYVLTTPFQILGVLILIALAIPTFIGLCAAIIITGRRLGEWRKPFYTNLRGGGLLLLACLAPLVGWFMFTPLLVFACIGSVVGSLVKPKVTETVPGNE